MRVTVALLLLLLACGPSRVADRLELHLAAHGAPPLAASSISYEPASNLMSARLGPHGRLVIERRDVTRPLTVHIPDLCPVTFSSGPHHAVIEMRPVMDLGNDRAPVGFDTRFTIAAERGCPEQGGRISWRQVEGAAVSELAVDHDGDQLSARMPRFDAVHPDQPHEGLVPISPRTQGRVVIEAVWRRPGRPAITRTLALVATSRATGLSSVAVSQSLLLAGSGWRVQHAPQAGHAQVHASGALSQFSADAPGRWALENDRGSVLALQAFWHDKTPYDCGRSECHAAIATDTGKSPMSHALERPLHEATPAAIGCRLDCHVLGERGLRDGGFLDVAGELGWTWHDGARWQDLPQALRRLGGVRCTACHGPGAIPEPEGREKVLRSDVCATCHDAPPNYLHVQQWRASHMASSDAQPRTRSGECARCHTTAGFLASVAARSQRTPDAEPAGIACAACHAPHASHSGARLVRTLPGDDDAALEPRSAVCVRCHMPGQDELPPSASSAAFWIGSARIPAADGDSWELVREASLHRDVPGGCVGCHGARASATPGAIDHTFRVDPAVCLRCHDHRPLAAVQQRAVALASRLDAACYRALQPSAAGGPRHADPPRARCPSQRLTRARYEVDLVLEDPAAAVHNAGLARRLLDDAERQLRHE